jgi:hypothetical protein
MNAKRVLSPETRGEGGCLVRVRRDRRRCGGGGVPRSCEDACTIPPPQPPPYGPEQKLCCVIND